MPLIRRDPSATPETGLPEPAAPSADLRSPDPDRRWAAARALAGDPAAAGALGQALLTEEDDRVREAILTGLVRTGGAPAVAALLPGLHSDNAALRAGVLDALQVLPDALRPELPGLLADPDVDVRVLAADLARHLAPEEATALLGELLDSEFDPNVCAAAIDALAEIGTPAAIPALERCAARFGSEAFLPFAAQVALQRIAGGRSPA